MICSNGRGVSFRKLLSTVSRINGRAAVISVSPNGLEFADKRASDVSRRRVRNTGGED
jgi:hypothetical protein